MFKRKAAVIAAIFAFSDDDDSNQKKPKMKKLRTKRLLSKREIYPRENLFSEKQLSNLNDYKDFLRMDEESFRFLLEKVSSLISRKDTRMRPAIPAEDRLIATLRFLATGRSFENLKFSSIISAQSLGHIIPETCEALYKVLQPDYLQSPRTTDEWKLLSRDFQEMWNFPYCLGALNGKHVQIVPRPNCGSFYYNNKSSFSIVLMAIVNANYEFIMIDVNTNERVSDEEAIQEISFYNKLMANTLELPETEDSVKLNYVFVGDEAFALDNRILKPFSKEELTHERAIFNYRLSRANRVSENAFGIMASRFRVFHSAINLSPSKIDSVVKACCVLHNFLRRHCRDSYTSHDILDKEDTESAAIIRGEWRNNIDYLLPMQSTHHQNSNDEVKDPRNDYVNYFNGSGKVSWQDQMVKNGHL